MKKEIEKAKSEIKDGIVCACTGCPGKNKHKIAASKTCTYKKLIGFKAADVPKMLAQFAAIYSHDVPMDMAEVLLKNFDARGGEPLSFLDALTILEVEKNKLLGNVKQNATETNAKKLGGSPVIELASGMQLTCIPCSNIPTSTNIAVSPNGMYVHKTSAGVHNVNPDQ
eukprot:1181413-Ditylum_brightwellii.AAC.1